MPVAAVRNVKIGRQEAEALFDAVQALPEPRDAFAVSGANELAEAFGMSCRVKVSDKDDLQVLGIFHGIPVVGHGSMK